MFAFVSDFSFQQNFYFGFVLHFALLDSIISVLYDLHTSVIHAGN